MKELVLRVRIEAPPGVRVRLEPEIVHVDEDAPAGHEVPEAAVLPRRRPQPDGERATAKQANYIYALGRRAGMSRREFEAWLMRIFRVETSYQLPRADVDRAIRMLKLAQRQHEQRQADAQAQQPEDEPKEPLSWQSRA